MPSPKVHICCAREVVYSIPPLGRSVEVPPTSWRFGSVCLRTSSIQFPQPPSSTPFPSVQNYPTSPIRSGAFARTRRPSLLSIAIKRTNKPSLAGVGLGNGNGNGSGTALGLPAFIDPPAPSHRPCGYTASYHMSISNTLGGGSSDAAMLLPTSSHSQQEDSGMITPLEEPPLNLPVGYMDRDNRDRGGFRGRRNGIIGGGEGIIRDLPIPKTPPRAMNNTVLPTAVPGFKRATLVRMPRQTHFQMHDTDSVGS